VMADANNSGPVVHRVVGAILRKEGQVLLGRRRHDRVSYPGVWDLPGGHLEAGESLQAALVRELEEELGITPEVRDAAPWLTRCVDGFELSVFIIDRWRGEPQNRAPHEHDEIRWIGPAELSHLPLAHPAYVELLTQALVGDCPP
jgi:8-oxo-dGTP diphosphatase